MRESNEPDEKRELRDAMRAMRRALPDRDGRSARIVGHVIELDAVRAANTMCVYDAVPGEVDTSTLLAWCVSQGIETTPPEDPDLDPAWPDVIIVPGTAFTVGGDRLGQGGGWYDQFLPERRPDAVTIGLGFDEQLVDSIPIEPHDVRLDVVVTDAGVRRSED